MAKLVIELDLGKEALQPVGQEKFPNLNLFLTLEEFGRKMLRKPFALESLRSVEGGGVTLPVRDYMGQTVVGTATLIPDEEEPNEDYVPRDLGIKGRR